MRQETSNAPGNRKANAARKSARQNLNLFGADHRLEMLEDRLAPALNILGIEEQDYLARLAQRTSSDQSIFLGRGYDPEYVRILVANSSEQADTTNTEDLFPAGSLGLNLTGAGYTVAMWDPSGSPRTTHQEFGGRVSSVGPAPINDHATLTAGVIAASGVNASAIGMATAVNVIANNVDQNINTNLAAIAGTAIVSNHSYSMATGWTRGQGSDVSVPVGNTDLWMGDRSLGTESNRFGKYVSETRDLDQVLHQNPYLLSVFSAGNERGEAFTNFAGNNTYVTFFSVDPGGIGWGGPGWYSVPASGNPGTTAPGADGGTGINAGFDTLGFLQVAKNILTVGSIQTILTDPFTSGSVFSATGSSWGGADDGRIKVDLVADGDTVFGPSSAGNASTTTLSGTSFAAANVSGAAALLIQHFNNRFGFMPLSASTKDIMLHTALDAGNVGPDYKFGWGVLDSKAAANFITNASTPGTTDNFFEGSYTGTEQILVFTSTGLTPLKATLTWNDVEGTGATPAGIDDPTAALVNNLDIFIEGPTGTLFRPWKLDPNNPTSNATRGINNVDNVEQVLIDNPQAGTYKIHIRHSGTSFNQDYSLAVSNAKLAVTPVITVANIVRGYVENDPPVLLEPTGTISDVDSTNFNGGNLTLRFISGSAPEDRLLVRNEGTGVGQIGVAGANVTYNFGAGPVVIGSFIGGNNDTNPLVITFNTNSTQVAINALMHNIAYNNVSELPVTTTRTIEWRLTDGVSVPPAPVTTQVTVSSVNDAPVNTIPAGPLAASEDADFFISGLAVADLDLNGNQLTTTLSVTNGGILTLNTTVFGGLTAGQITGNGSSLVVLVGTPIQINTTLANATGLKFRAPLNFNGNVTLTMTSDDGGFTGPPGPLQDSDNVVINVAPVNDTPAITVNAGPLTYVENTSPLLFVTGATVVDIDGLDFNTGTLTVGITGGGFPEDRLAFRSEGTGAGQIGISGANITFGGVLIGTFTGGVGFNDPLIATFNANATASAVQALMRNVTYQNVSENPNTTSRVITFVLTDGDGGTSNTANSTVAINSVNDAPVNTVPGGTLTTQEDVTRNINGISVADIDIANGNARVTLSVLNGRITVRTDIPGGLSFVQVSGNVTNTVVITAPISVINATFANASGIQYIGNLNYNGADTLTVTTSDQGNTGTPGALVDTDTVALSITAVNDAPVNGTPFAPLNGSEDQSISITGMSISDVDAGAALMSVTLTINNGFLNVRTNVGGGLVAGDITGNGTANITISATVAKINATFASTAGITYQPNADFFGTSTMTIVTNDNGNAGAGGALSDTDNVTINVQPVNDAPANTVPGNQNATEDTNLVFSGGNGNPISVADSDAGVNALRLTLTASNGVVTLASFAGLQFITGDGSADQQMSFTGTQSAINSALNGLVFRGNQDYFGPASLTVNTNDQGNTGSGGSIADIDVININVAGVNDNPILNINNAGFGYNEDSGAVILSPSGTVSDVDGLNFDTGVFTVSITANGAAEDRLGIRNEGTGIGQIGVSGNTVTFEGTAIGTFTGGGSGSSPLVITFNANSTAASIQALTRNLTYANVSNVPSTLARTVQYSLTDGDGGTSNTGSTTITVFSINDLPVNSLSGNSFTVDGNLKVSFGGFSISDADAGLANVQVTFNATNGVVSVRNDIAGGVTAGQITGNNSASVTLVATIAAINTTIGTANSISFQANPTFDFGGAVTMVTNDLGNTGSGGARTDTDVITINDAAVNPNLIVDCTPGNDNVIVKPYGASTTDLTVEINGVTAGRFRPSALTPLVINGLAGDDTITGDASVAIGFQVDGGAGNDLFVGGSGADTFKGGDGNDLGFGQSGNDLLFGQNDNDSMDGGDGDDAMNGDAGNDLIFGSAGNDRMFGADGNDALDGGDGNDSMEGNVGDDLLFGGNNDDFLFGQDGNDSMDGNAGLDQMDGGTGNDLMFGSAGNDQLFGLAGNDSMDGGDGNDFVDGGIDNDVMFGSAGNDTLFGRDGFDNIDGGANNDIIDGGADNDALFGSSGDDQIFGQAGDDSIDGNDGNDRIECGDGNDLAFGSGNSDTLLGGAGNDSLDGGTGSDVADGGPGNNLVLGIP